MASVQMHLEHIFSFQLALNLASCTAAQTGVKIVINVFFKKMYLNNVKKIP